MDIRMTVIIGRASAIRVNCWKWVGPSVDTTDPSHSEFQVWCSSVVWFWSYSLPKVSQRSVNRMYCRTLFPVSSLKQRSIKFYSIGKLHDPVAACQLFVVVAASLYL